MRKKPHSDRLTGLCISAAIAALYTVLTLISTAFGMGSGPIQLRISEALCILPIFTPTAIPGLFIGCLVSNLISGAVIWDVIFGSLATLIGAVGSFAASKIKSKKLRYTVGIASPIIANTLIIPPVLKLVYGVDLILPLIFLTVFIGELLSVGVLGGCLAITVAKRNVKFK